MAQHEAHRRPLHTGLALATLLAVSLSACGRVAPLSNTAVKEDKPASAAPGVPSTSPGGGAIDMPSTNPVDETPILLNPVGDSGGADTPSLVGSVPQPRPGLTTMNVSVTATTSSFYPGDNKLINTANPVGGWISNLLKPYAKYANQRITIIDAKIMWLPVQNAVKYKVTRFADNDPKGHQLFYQVPDNKFMRKVGGYLFAIDGVLPVDTLSLGPNNGLHPYTTYHYVVQAYDASGNLITQNDANDAAATTTPLDEVASPSVGAPIKGALVKELDPLFTWYDRTSDPQLAGVKQGLEPDGFFLSTSLQGVPIWSTYKDGPKATVVRYGQKLGWHPRLNPFSQLVTIPLSVGKTYAWAVTAIKADAARRAIAKSTSPAGTFTVGTGATQVGTGSGLLSNLTNGLLGR